MTTRDGDDASPDHQLVVAAQAGDAAAFDALVARYRAAIESFLRRDVGFQAQTADFFDALASNCAGH